MRIRLKEKPLVAVLSLVVTLAAGGQSRGQSSPSNLNELKGEMKVLSAAIDAKLSQTFAPPFGVLEKTKGTYLPDFGVLFSLEVNLYPTRIPTPFDSRALTAQEIAKADKIKRERIKVIQQSVTRLLSDYSGSLRGLGPGESAAVVVHLFQVQEQDEKIPAQLVLEVKKADLDQYQDKKISYDALLGKMKSLEL